MNFMMLVGGLVGGIIGVVIWVIVGLMGYEVGWIALGIGGLAGLGTRLFNDEDTPLGALSAACIAALTILLGKYAVFLFVAPDGASFSDMFAGFDILWFIFACGTAARMGFVGEGD